MLEEFKRELKNKNRTKKTLSTIDYVLENAQKTLNKPLETLSIEDLKKYFESLKAKGLNPNSINLQEQIFIQFYDFCLNETDDEKFSLLIRKIKRLKVDKVKSSINPNDILLPEDIKKLINVATIERDRCIIASLYESGMRRGEFLSLKNDMVQMDELKQEVIFHIPNIEGCKTGSRSITCLEIYGYVQDWMKCNTSDYFIPLKPSGLGKIIRNLFQLSGIKKPCNIHHFRHSAITHAAGIKMTETEMSYRFWGIPHSMMLSVYIHLNEQLKSSGYRDAKGMGEGNGKTIINPLAVRCVECGKLIQTGSLCEICAKQRKLSEENQALQEQLKIQHEDIGALEYQHQKDLQAMSFEIDKQKQDMDQLKQFMKDPAMILALAEALKMKAMKK